MRTLFFMIITSSIINILCFNSYANGPYQLRQELDEVQKNSYQCQKKYIKYEALLKKIATKRILLNDKVNTLEREITEYNQLHLRAIRLAPLSRFFQTTYPSAKIELTMASIARNFEAELNAESLVYYNGLDVAYLIETFLRLYDNRQQYLTNQKNELLNNYERSFGLFGFDEEEFIVKLIVTTQELIKLNRQALFYSKHFTKRVLKLCTKRKRPFKKS